jgi:hypothetical protein
MNRAPLTTSQTLLGFPMQRMFAAAVAKLFKFHTTRIIPTVFLSRIVTFLALSASQSNDRANIFLF